MKHIPCPGRRSRAAIVAGLLAISTPALAAEVAGTVTLDGRPFSGILRLPDGSQVEVKNGEYRIFVPAGVYSVVFDNGQKFDATIQSFAVPATQHVKLASAH